MSFQEYWRDPVRRNVALLALCQAFFMSVQSAAIATTPLAGHMLLGTDKSLATLPIFLGQLGIMVATLPASFLMKHAGRRLGFSVGAIIGVISGLLSAWAIYEQSFIWLCVGAFAQGIGGAFAWYFRFAAADISSDDFKAKAISLVMAGGVLAGLFGPQAAKSALHWFAPLTYVGVYVMIAIFSAISLVIVQGLRIPRPTAEVRASGGRPLGQIARQPAFIFAVTASMFGYGAMTLVMATTPLAMQAYGYTFSNSATVIQAHVVAMFLPSFFTGHLIKRYGAVPIIIIGALIEAGCALVNLAGIDFMNFLIGLSLMGLGWNFTYVGGSTLLTTVYKPSEQAKVQGVHDFAVYAMTAVAAGLSGFLQQKSGWDAVNIAVLPAMGLVVCIGLWMYVQERRGAQMVRN